MVTLILAVGLAFGANAQGRTNDLLKQCEGDHKVYCAGYIAGLYDGLATRRLMTERYRICPPVRRNTQESSVSYAQMMDIFVDWAKANQAVYRNVERWRGVRLALSEAFPCSTEKPAGPAQRAKAAGAEQPAQEEAPEEAARPTQATK